MRFVPAKPGWPLTLFAVQTRLREDATARSIYEYEFHLVILKQGMVISKKWNSY